MKNSLKWMTLLSGLWVGDIVTSVNGCTIDIAGLRLALLKVVDYSYSNQQRVDVTSIGAIRDATGEASNLNCH